MLSLIHKPSYRSANGVKKTSDPTFFYGLGCLKTRKSEHVMIGKERGQQMEKIKFKPKVCFRRELDFVHRFLLFPCFSSFGDVHEWSTLKLMLHIVGWQAQ